MAHELSPVILVEEQLPEQRTDALAMQAAQEHESRWRGIARKTAAVLALSASAVFAAEAAPAPAHDAHAATVEAPWDSGSPNWAGYAVPSPSNLDYVTADFIVPSVTCPDTGDYEVSMWAGVGKGTSDSDPLYQTGVRLDCYNGTETSYVWYQANSPDGNTGEVDFTSRTNEVSAGDKIVVQVNPNDGVTTTLQDYGSDLSNSSPNWTASHPFYTSDSPTQAECIVERPKVGSSYADLVEFDDAIDFSTATSGSFNKACDVTANDVDHIISSSSESLNGLTDITDHAFIEDSSSNELASTSDPSGSGDFTVTWIASS